MVGRNTVIGVGLVWIVFDGGIGAEFFDFLVGAFAGGYLFGAEVVRVMIFRWQKIGLVRKLAGEHQNGGKKTWSGNGGEIPRKDPSQLSPCGDCANGKRNQSGHD